MAGRRFVMHFASVEEAVRHVEGVLAAAGAGRMASVFDVDGTLVAWQEGQEWVHPCGSAFLRLVKTFSMALHVVTARSPVTRFSTERSVRKVAGLAGVQPSSFRFRKTQASLRIQPSSETKYRQRKEIAGEADIALNVGDNLADVLSLTSLLALADDMRVADRLDAALLLRLKDAVFTGLFDADDLIALHEVLLTALPRDGYLVFQGYDPTVAVSVKLPRPSGGGFCI